MASTSLAEGSDGLVVEAERGTAPQSQSMQLLRQPRLSHNQTQLVRSHLASRRRFALRSGELEEAWDCFHGLRPLAGRAKRLR